MAWIYLGLALKRLATLEFVARYVKLQSYQSAFVQLAPVLAQVPLRGYNASQKAPLDSGLLREERTYASKPSLESSGSLHVY